MLSADALKIRNLGERTHPSPLDFSTRRGDGIGNFIFDETRVRSHVELLPGQKPRDDVLYEKAGPREMLYFRPERTKAALVTCGGLCPGINDVIRSMVLELYHHYEVTRILGIRFGFQGMNPDVAAPPFQLDPDFVENIHRNGGTVLGSSRGSQPVDKMVDFLQDEKVDILFCVGGDGTQKGAHEIWLEIERREAKIAVVGVPKTIDNDIPFVTKTFGYSTALEEARKVIDCAHMEAKGLRNGIGLVKVMGRDAGFIAAGATLASQEVNFTLIPEIPFELEGKDGFLEVLKKRLEERGHAVIVVAEGAGQHLFESAPTVRDASGNLKHNDIGQLLKEEILEYFQKTNFDAGLKYIDPSYIIRSVPANSDDRIFCNALARHSVHAGMAGKTDLLIGHCHDIFLHIPIPTAVSAKKRISPEGRLWMSVLETTGQPLFFGRKVVEEGPNEP